MLSGHDHDQCTVIHPTSVGTVKEVWLPILLGYCSRYHVTLCILQHTVGTVSWHQGNLYPSFMLLSVVSSSSNSINSEDAVSTQLCFLPKQAHIYFWYCIFISYNSLLSSLIVYELSNLHLLAGI